MNTDAPGYDLGPSLSEAVSCEFALAVFTLQPETSTEVPLRFARRT
jgi:hypothetical protein